jgi:Outer membrane protein beta-barrel domain
MIAALTHHREERADSMRLARQLAGLMLTLSAVAATAQTTSKESAVTLYGAYRDGGSFTDATSNRTLRLDASSAWAISYDKGLDDSRQLQFYASYQSTRLELDQSAVVNPPSATIPAPLPMKVIYFHLGGTSFLDGPIGHGPYLVGGLGATLFQPGSSGYGDEVRPSLNLGIGYQKTLGEHVALRVETRGYVTLVNSSGGLFCSGGCLFKIKGDAVTQGEVQLGLSYRF